MRGKVISYKMALEAGINPAAYLYRSGIIPIGKTRAVLDAKIWGGMVMGIGCYFTSLKDGTKFLLTVYYDTAGKGYRLSGTGMDILTCPIHRVYDLHIGENGRGNPVLADLIGPTDD